MRAKIEHIIQQLKDVQNGKNWMGANFERRLAQISEDQVFTRPLPEMHSIAEIYSHLTFWRKETIVKIKSGKGFLTDDDAGNWQGNEALKKIGWQTIKQEHDDSLNELIALLETKEDSFLDEGEYYDSDFKGTFHYSFAINGMLHHDIYHLGQLGMIIKFLKMNRITGNE